MMAFLTISITLKFVSTFLRTKEFVSAFILAAFDAFVRLLMFFHMLLYLINSQEQAHSA